MERNDALTELCEEVRSVLALLEMSSAAQKRSALVQEVRARLAHALRTADRAGLSTAPGGNC